MGAQKVGEKGCNKLSSNNEEFDRSKCFTFFSTYATQGKRIRKAYGDKVAADYYEAIIDYGLNQKPIEDEQLMLLIGDTMLETIDASQKKRSRAFGEDMNITRSIIELVRDRPGISQNDVAKEVGCSKGKVNQALKKFREGKYENVFDFNIIINGVEYRSSGQVVTDQDESEYEVIDAENNDDSVVGRYINTNNNINNNYNSTDRDRDRFADHYVHGSVTESRCAPEVADAPIANAQKDPEREKKREENLKYFKSLDYGGIMANDLIPEVCEAQYTRAKEEYEDETMDETRERLMKFLTGGFVLAKKELAEELVNTVMAGNGRL